MDYLFEEILGDKLREILIYERDIERFWSGLWQLRVGKEQIYGFLLNVTIIHE